MKKKKRIKRMSAILLAGMLMASMAPAGALAAEMQGTYEAETESEAESETDASVGNGAENAGSGEGQTGTGDETGSGEPGGGTEGGTVTEPETGTGDENGSGGNGSGEPGSAGQTQPVVLTDAQTGITVQGDSAALPAMGMLYVTKVDSGEAMELLNQYFSLIADQFAAFDIRILSLPDMSLAEPDAAVLISVPLPEGYDPGRAAVYYTDGTGMPAEVSAQVTEGNLVFESDHVGTFIVAEKKDNSGMQTDLPSYLEPTQKTEKLQLQKTSLPGRVSLPGSYGAPGEYISPQTGDNANFVIWIVVLVAAVAAVVVVIVLKKRK